MAANALKKEFIEQYNAIGEQKFYRFLLCKAIYKIIEIKKGEAKKIESPEIELLNAADVLYKQYLREGTEVYFEMSKVYRKAGHKIYRLQLKQGLINKNNRFLNLV